MFSFLYLLGLSIVAFLMILVSVFHANASRMIILLNSISTSCLLGFSTQISQRHQKCNMSKTQHREPASSVLPTSVDHHPPTQLLYIEHECNPWLLTSFPFFSANNQWPIPSFLHSKHLLNQCISFHFTEITLQATGVTFWQDLKQQLGFSGSSLVLNTHSLRFSWSNQIRVDYSTC